MRFIDPTPEDDGPGDATSLSPGFRPEMLLGPEHEQRRRAVQAALFGGVPEATSFGRYRLLHLLGHGGMGRVYAAYDDRLDRKIALKLILASRLDSNEVRERTLREARALARLSHPHVVHVYEVGEIERQLFVAMECLAGPTLRTWLDGQVRPWRETLAVLRQAGEGLAAAHAHGIVHRDFKPQNAMFGADGRVRVLDFGLASMGETEVTARAGEVEGSVERPEPGLTLTGTLLGTPAYMAPEQFTRRSADAHSDQFTFCVTLYEALYGHRPFTGETLAKLGEAITSGRIAARPKDTQVPQWVHSALLRGLQAEPIKRWPSMRALLAELGRTPGAWGRRVLASAALVAITGAATFAVSSSNGVAVEQCPDAGVELAEVWGEARAAAVREAVSMKHAAHAAVAGEVLALVEPRIDRYAGEWVLMRNGACRAHAEGRQSSHIFDLRTACLDQRRAGLDALVRILEAADAALIHNVPQAAAELPPLDRCADIQALTAAIAPPQDEWQKARVQQHREHLSEVQVHMDAGSYRRGREIVDEVLADADAVAYEPLLAEVYLSKGSLEMESFADADALGSFDKALWTALRVGHATVAAQASSRRGFTASKSPDRIEHARAALPLTAALNHRVMDDVDVYAGYLHNTGMIYLHGGDPVSARKWLEAARALREVHGREERLSQLTTLRALAVVADRERRLEDMEAAFGEFRRLSAKVAAPGSTYNRAGESAFAFSRMSIGRPRQAREVAAGILAAMEGLDNDRARFLILIALVDFSLEDEDLQAARRYLPLVMPLLPKVEGETAMFTMWQMTEMRAAAAEGDASAVQAHLTAARSRVEAAGESREMYDLYFLREHGRALVALGRQDEAVESLERLRAMYDQAPADMTDTLGALRASSSLGRLYRQLGRHDLAERVLERALTSLDEVRSTRNFDHAPILKELGELALDRQDVNKAVEHLTEAESLFATTAESDYLPLVRTRFVLAQALTEAGTAGPVAQALAAAALQAFRAKNKPEEARAVEAWVAEHS